MDFLEEHLELTARQLFDGRARDVMHEYAEFVKRFRPDAEERWRSRRMSLPYAESLVLGAASRVLKQDGFEIPGGSDAMRSRIEAKFEREYDCRQGWLAFLTKESATLRLGLKVRVAVGTDDVTRLETNHSLVTWEQEFERRLRHLLADIPEDFEKLARSAKLKAVLHNPVLEPGRELLEAFTGNLRDYSGCATRKEVQDLEDGVLPLGYWAFRDDPDARTEHGPALYLTNWRTGAPMIYNGALICAPQNSGKTDLIMRWAIAANRNDYSVFLVDVKGNMRDELGPHLRGKVFCFSTDPDEDSDRINFLAGLHGTTPRDSMRVRQLVEALLPRDGWEQGEQAYFYQNHFNWFSALVHVTLLVQHYQPEAFARGRAHLGHVFEVASNYRDLLACLRNVAIFEGHAREKGQMPAEPGIDYWRSEIALLLHPDDGGERTSDYSYRTLTGSIVNALRPFSRFGTLYSKTGGARWDGEHLSPDRSFTLEMLGDPAEPVTMILAAREQDLDDASTILTIAIRKLQQFLFDRMKHKGLRPVLLLLDETRRIRGFKANEYITFARQAQAGCVIVYQSLDQIGEEPAIREILENVGTQIYLGSLTGTTARYFIEGLPVRFRPKFGWNVSYGEGDGAPNVQTGQETVQYFTTNELYRLPAGEWPALVYINGQPRRKPILVDLDRNPLGNRG